MRVIPKIYTPEFKSDDLSVLHRSGRAIAHVAADLGVNHWTLRGWYKQDQVSVQRIAYGRCPRERLKFSLARPCTGSRRRGHRVPCKKVAEGLAGLNRELNGDLDERTCRTLEDERQHREPRSVSWPTGTSQRRSPTHSRGTIQAQDEQRQIDAIVDASRTPIHLPLPDELVEREFELESIIAEDPNRGREMLARFFEGGALPVHPQADGSYIAKSRFFPLALLAMNEKPRSPSLEAGLPANRQSRGLSPSCSSLSCAGRI
jgi:transposase-like protein